MNRELKGSLLSTVFVDYDNIYLSLKRKSEEAAVRFAKDAGRWVQAIASGRLITPTNGVALNTPRRIVMNRCYGNPVPRRNAQDNATDMNSFPFVRHHFLRAGFEVIDCPPLTAQLKNSADIRMVMDVRDYLLHDTYFDEFIVLSGDADFTPLLHRLRQHARRTVVYANDYTAAPYTAISDGEVRESDLIDFLLEGTAAPELGQPASSGRASSQKGLPSPEMLAETRKAIIGEVLATVRSAPQPVLLETLADRAVRVLGHERTVGSAWGGAGSFRDLMAGALPSGLKLSDSAPYYVYDASRQLASAPRAYADERPAQREPQRLEPRFDTLPEGFNEIPLDRPAPLPVARAPEREAYEPYAPQYLPTPQQPPERNDYADHRAYAPQPEPQRIQHAPQRQEAPRHEPAARHEAPRYEPVRNDAARNETPRYEPVRNEPQRHEPARHEPQRHEPVRQHQGYDAPRAQHAAPEPAESASALQQSIARIHEACQAPPLSPPEYRALFDVMAKEIEQNGLTGARTLVNICDRARELGIDLRKDDARFILEVISEADPWFEQGASANLFASRFRNFVVARCKRQGLKLTATELDLIEAWFTGTGQQAAAPRATQQGNAPAKSGPAGPTYASAPHQAPSAAPRGPAPSASVPQYADTDHHAPRQIAGADTWWRGEAPADHRIADHRQADHRPAERPVDARGPAPTGYGAGGGGGPRYNEFAGHEPDDEFPRIVRGRLRG